MITKRLSTLAACAAFIILLLSGCTRPEGESSYTATLQKTQDELSRARFTDQQANYARQISANMPEYKKLFESSFADTADIKMHVLLMIHSGSINQLTMPTQAVVESQDMVAKKLRELRPDIVGYEGLPLERVTKQAYAEAMVVKAAEFGVRSSLAEALILVDKMTEQDGVLQYLKEFPDAYVTGTEDDSVYTLQATMSMSLSAQYGKNIGTQDPMQPLFDSLVELRSQIALAKVIKKLREQKKTTGAIVIGVFHSPGLLEFSRNLKMQTEYYALIPESILRDNPDMRLKK